MCVLHHPFSKSGHFFAIFTKWVTVSVPVSKFMLFGFVAFPCVMFLCFVFSLDVMLVFTFWYPLSMFLMLACIESQWDLPCFSCLDYSDHFFVLDDIAFRPRSFLTNIFTLTNSERCNNFYFNIKYVAFFPYKINK